MAGHSKWATTKHKKAANDAKRAKMFAKMIKDIEVAARSGGGDPAGNPTLETMIAKAKRASVPNDNIERARKRGSGEEAGGANWESVTYEGYGANGVAVLIECLTDNRNRAATEVRTAMSKNGGNLGESGSVAYMFSRVGVVTVKKGELTEDDVLAAVLEAGAEEVNDRGQEFEVVCAPTDLHAVRDALKSEGIEVEDADQDFRASVEVELDVDGAKKMERLIDALEDSDDVQNVYTNMSISDEVAAQLDED
ncbi:YebC/PmpR family DNA-binding transcriptional regulator [Corynebacterium timonense]|uniref:Probable transcriptional regulatory protein SAMN04488539_0797 n=1 Tax=Corynebacterium timonense TaxID=441500 RepID=A0A1H1NJY2_9CORY|nr:YebC/PmpR family DNA-binding transcriptional regulator [Corynebacterium timonense]SDR99302.1 DNA-binding regulatory protein, YebC/PmpR family [Corynebacterium timonense]